MREPIPVGKRGVREGCLPAREACFSTGREACFPYRNPFPLASVGYGKVALPRGKLVSAHAGLGYGKRASRTGTRSRWQAWATGRLPSRTGTLFLHRRGVWEGHPVWGFKIIKAEGGGVGGAVGRPASIVCRLVSQTECASPACGRRPRSAQPPPPTAARRPPPSLHPPLPPGVYFGHPVNPLRELAIG